MKIKLGFSVYVSSFERQKDLLEKLRGEDILIFSSFHIQEEFNDSYNDKALRMVKWLKEQNFKVIADVSVKTLEQFNFETLDEFLEVYKVDGLRLDYGFSRDEIIELSKTMPIVVNASTETIETLEALNEPIACHNFYPRPETGLSECRFKEMNEVIQSLDIPIMSFIPGSDYRGPIFEGLPTLEKHRKMNSYVAFMDLKINYGIDRILVGDLDIDSESLKWILHYMKTDEITLPVVLDQDYRELYNTPLTIRIDSGAYAYRIMESREYSCQGVESVQPHNCIERTLGSITIDNDLYKRYRGEIQIIHSPLDKDEKVNVIGHVKDEYLELLKMIKCGDRIKLRRER